MTAYTYDLPASDEQLKAVGMVAAEYSYLESIVETAIWALDEDAGREISTDRMRARLKILRKLYRQRWPDDEAGANKLDKLCEEIRSAECDLIGLYLEENSYSMSAAVIEEKRKSVPSTPQGGVILSSCVRSLRDFLLGLTPC